MTPLTTVFHDDPKSPHWTVSFEGPAGKREFSDPDMHVALAAARKAATEDEDKPGFTPTDEPA